MATNKRKTFKDLTSKANLMYFIPKNGNILKGRFCKRIPQVRTTDELLLFTYEPFPLFSQAITIRDCEWNKVSLKKGGFIITPSRNEAIEISNKIKYDLKFKK